MRVFIVGSFVVACTVKVARLPRAGESLGASAFTSEPGGKGFNLALAARRLGAEVDGLFAVGGDAFAGIAAATFAELGFPAEMLVARAGSTGAGIGFVDAEGENCLAVHLGANLDLGADDVARAAPRLARAGLVAATFESPDAAIGAAFARARAAGTRTLLNPSPYRPIHPSILADTAVLVVNAVEAAALGLDLPEDPSTDPPASWRATDAVAALLRAGPDALVVTLGRYGAVAFDRSGPARYQPAFPVAAVDTIGAGDAFAAGFLVGLLEARSVADSLRRAAACGAVTASRFGAFEAFPTASALEAFLASAG